MGAAIEPSDVESAARSAGKSQLHTAQQVLRQVEPALSAEGKEMILQFALMVASVDGSFDEAEGEVIGIIASSLGITNDHFRGIVAGLGSDR